MPNSQYNDVSILQAAKEMLGGLYESQTTYDSDLISFINAEFAILWTLGIGPDEGFAIDTNTKWSEYITDPRLNNIRLYLQTRLKITFDTPENTGLLNALYQEADRLEKHISWTTEHLKNESVGGGNDTN